MLATEAIYSALQRQATNACLFKMSYEMHIFIPVLDISRVYCFWGDSPGTTKSASRKSFKIKLAAYFRIRSTSVRNVIAVEGHHVAKNICDRSQI